MTEFPTAFSGAIEESTKVGMGLTIESEPLHPNEVHLRSGDKVRIDPEQALPPLFSNLPATAKALALLSLPSMHLQLIQPDQPRRILRYHTKYIIGRDVTNQAGCYFLATYDDDTKATSYPFHISNQFRVLIFCRNNIRLHRKPDATDKPLSLSANWHHPVFDAMFSKINNGISNYKHFEFAMDPNELTIADHSTYGTRVLAGQVGSKG